MPMDAATPDPGQAPRALPRGLRAIRLLPSAMSICRRWLQRRGVSRGLAEMAASIRAGGLLGLRRMWLDHGEPVRYREWLRAREVRSGDVRTRLQRLSHHPAFAVVIDARGAPDAAARASRLSVARQAFAAAVVCVSEDGAAAWRAPTDTSLVRPGWDDIRAAGAATGAEFVVFLRAGELLHAEALLRGAEVLGQAPGKDLLYADHDRMDGLGGRYDPWFKAGWDPDLLLVQDYLGPMTAIAASALPVELGFRDLAPGVLSWAVKLYATQGMTSDRVHHVLEVLAHVGESVAPPDADRAAALVARFLAHRGEPAAVEHAGERRWRVRRPLLPPPPCVSVIVPTRDQRALLERCVDSVLSRTPYPDVEVVVIDNRSVEPATHAFLVALGARPNVRVLNYDAPFNFAAINNWAVRQASGQVVCLLNNDTEVISPHWLEEMVSQAVRPDVGAVGAMLYYPDDTIQHAGVQLGLAGFLGHRCLRRPRGFAGPHDCLLHVQQMHVVTAACLVIRKSVYEEVGGMDEEAFPIAYNDVDFCLRILERGYRNLWTPYAELYHHESATRGSDLDPLRAGRLDAERRALRARWGERLRGDMNDYARLL